MRDVRTFADVGMMSGHATLADVLFLIAAILAIVGGVIRVMRKQPDGWLVAFAVAGIALGLLVL